MAQAPKHMTHSSQVVAALESAWRDMQKHTPDMPDAVLILGSGTTGRSKLHGHHWHDKWVVDGRGRAEILLAGESFKRGAVPTFGTLMHEAAHALARKRKIQDTSRGGRYHNKRFKTLANELGLTIAYDKGIGYSPTTVPDQTIQRYKRAIERIDAALVMYRREENRMTGFRKGKPGTVDTGDGIEESTRNYVKAICSCEPPHIIRCSHRLLFTTSITCGDCGDSFAEV